MRKTTAPEASTGSDAVRRHAYERYISVARRRRDKTVSINVGEVHRALALSNRVPLVCAALGSKKFLTEHGLRIVSKTGPPSGQSTTVTFTYEIVGKKQDDAQPSRQEAWNRLRGSMKDIFAELGGGENYLRNERANSMLPGKIPWKICEPHLLGFDAVHLLAGRKSTVWEASGYDLVANAGAERSTYYGSPGFR
jgi:hypothetical protein